MLLPLEVPAGVDVVNSPNAAKGRYVGTDKVRFVKGFPEKWPGWVRFLSDAVDGVSRGAVSWTNQYGNTNAAIGTHLKLYAITGDDTLTNITPVRATSALGTDPLSMTSGETRVVVTDTAHGADATDFVAIDNATAAAGITVGGEYQITEIIDGDHFAIEHSTPATSTATGGGSSAGISYRVHSGTTGSSIGLGWGAGAWGEGTWGTARQEGIVIEMRHWSLSNYGNDLLASPSLGSIYLWQEATDSFAEQLTGAPSSCRAMFVTPERFVMALGTTTPMTVQWPDQDDPTDWTPSLANTANERALQSGSKLMGGVALADGVSVVWSDTSLYLFQYTGSEFIYDSRLVASNCGLIAPLGFTKAEGVAYWIGPRQFYRYSSGIQAIQNSSDVVEYVFRTMDPTQAAKTWAEYDPLTQQVRWFYCGLGSVEPDRYVDVSLDGSWAWTVGTLNRTTGTHYRSSEAVTLRVDEEGVVWAHGVGLDAGDEPLEAYVTYGLYALSHGEKNVDVKSIIPDCQRQSGNLSFEVVTKERPNSAAYLDSQTVEMRPHDEMADIRVNGRHFGMTVRSNEIGGDFRLGVVQLEIGDAGARD